MVLYTRTGLVQDCRHSGDGATSQDLLSLTCSMSLEGGCLQGCWVGSTGNPQAHRTLGSCTINVIYFACFTAFSYTIYNNMYKYKVFKV